MKSNGTIRIYKDATAIVTGGASGIGRALAEELAKRGCEVVLADCQVEPTQQIASKINGSGGRATAVNVNVTDFPAMENLVRETVQRTGRLDYMFNNAGIAIYGNADLYGIDDWRYMLDVNLRGVVNGVQAAYRTLLNQGFGHIVNTASVAGLIPCPGAVSYAAAKHAVVGLSLSLRIEAESAGVRVSVLCPGVIRTPILEGGKYGRMLRCFPPEDLREAWEKFRPMAPGPFASKALDSIAMNKAVIIVPSRWKAQLFVSRLVPSLSLSLARRFFQKSQRNLAKN